MDPTIISEHSQSFPSRHPSPPAAQLIDETPTHAQQQPWAMPADARMPAQPKPDAQVDPSLTAVDLPSQFIFYPFKALSVKPIRGVHQAKFVRSSREQANRHMADAISTLLSDGVSSYDLTLPDYYWLLYFLRLTFYPKSQLIHKSVCTNPQHVLDVSNGVRPKESLINVTNVARTTIKDTVLNYEEAMKGFDEDGALRTELQDVYNLELYPSTVRDMVELELMHSPDPDFAEVEFLADVATFVRGRNGAQLPLKDRIEMVGNFPPHLMELIEDYRERITNYGAEETIKVKCMECGADIVTQVSISAHSFL